MPKRTTKIRSPLDWIELLNLQEIVAAREEALIDAYGDDEQLTALICIVDSELKVPFTARVLGAAG